MADHHIPMMKVSNISSQLKDKSLKQAEHGQLRNCNARTPLMIVYRACEGASFDTENVTEDKLAL